MQVVIKTTRIKKKKKKCLILEKEFPDMQRSVKKKQVFLSFVECNNLFRKADRVGAKENLRSAIILAGMRL